MRIFISLHLLVCMMPSLLQSQTEFIPFDFNLGLSRLEQDSLFLNKSHINAQDKNYIFTYEALNGCIHLLKEKGIDLQNATVPVCNDSIFIDNLVFGGYALNSNGISFCFFAQVDIETGSVWLRRMNFMSIFTFENSGSCEYVVHRENSVYFDNVVCIPKYSNNCFTWYMSTPGDTDFVYFTLPMTDRLSFFRGYYSNMFCSHIDCESIPYPENYSVPNAANCVNLESVGGDQIVHYYR